MSSGRTKIPDALHPVLLDLAGSLHPETRARWTSAQLAAWLLAEHGVEVCPRTVSNLLRTLRTEATQGLQDDVRAALLGKLTGQVEAFDAELDALLHDLATAPNLKLGQRAEVVETFRKALDTKLRWAGIGEKASAEVSVTGTPDGLAAFLATAFRQGDGPPPKVGE